MQLKRKWLSLPFLLIFPIVIVGLVLIIITSFLSPDEKHPIKVGLVDLDHSAETQMVVDLIDETSELGTFIQIQGMSKSEADKAIASNQLSSYIIFPENFTTNLYFGKSIAIPIVGNSDQTTESHLIKELIESVTRHIRASQANILTINYYAAEMGMDTDARDKLLFEQFKEYFFYTVGRDKIINDKEISNSVTATPLHYYGIAGWFIIITIWLLSIYTFLTIEDPLQIRQRMKLYGVTAFQQVLAKIFVTLITASLFAIGAFILLQKLLMLDLGIADYLRILFIMLLYGLVFLQGLAIIESIIPSQKFRVLGQVTLTGLLLILSGAIIPVLYFPLWAQHPVTYSYSYEGFHWLQEIILNNRLFADYMPLLLMNASGVFVLIALSLWKGRV